MGSWGVGMQASDTAMDSISEVKRIVKKKDRADAKKVRYALQTQRTEPAGLLGAAEYLYEDGFDISKSLGLIEEAVETELMPDQLYRWVDSDARRIALNRFRAAAKSPANLEAYLKDSAEDNVGLIEKMLGRKHLQ